MGCREPGSRQGGGTPHLLTAAITAALGLIEVAGQQSRGGGANWMVRGVPGVEGSIVSEERI